jgi:hypothetical protein
MLQAGHQNTNSNCETWLHGLTGAPLELETNIRIRDRLSQILIERGFQVYLTDANYNCDPKASTTDYDLFLALHCDSDYAQATGGFVDYPDPSQDMVNAESKRIRDAIVSEYFDHSGMVEHPERSNANTKFYYMWKYLSARTPCVLIEMGESADPHDRVLLNDTERIASALGRGICKAFNVEYDLLPPIDPCADIKSRLNELQSLVDGLKKQVESEQKFDEELARILDCPNQQSNILGEIEKLKNVEDQLRTMTKNFNESQIALSERERMIEDMDKEIKSLSARLQNAQDMSVYYNQLESQFEKCQMDLDICHKQSKTLTNATVKELLGELCNRLFGKK